MKLTVFQSGKGDCLLLTGKGSAPKRILIDGGMADAYTTHVAPALGALQQQGKKLDRVYVSHIDEDHISGVLQMLDDLVAWRVHDFQIAHGNPTHPSPGSDHPRPPKVDGIWHNSFQDQVPDHTVEIQNLLAAMAVVLSGAPGKKLRDLSVEHRNLATSMTQALQVSRRIGSKELGIPLNPEFGKKLMMIKPVMPSLQFGTMEFLVIGPAKEDLEMLRGKWIDWLKETKTDATVRAVREESEENQRNLGNNAMPLLQPLIAAAKILGRRSKVTPPNLASLMFFVEEAGRTLLLTGDGHWQDILNGLTHHGKLSAQGNIHVNVLKGQHHGSEHNWHETFCKAVTADHYIFCGNGFSENPDLDVIQAVVDSRLGNATQRSTHPKTGNSFKLSFNSNSTASNVKTERDHMAKVETLVKTLASQSGGKMKFSFLAGSQFQLTV
jgi:beta-lactamase superfamily II metal-dependent hydrolase